MRQSTALSHTVKSFEEIAWKPPPCPVPTAAPGIWAIYRIARGWLALKEGKPLPSA